MPHQQLNRPTPTEWLARLNRLADDVDIGSLTPRATATEIRSIVQDVSESRQRAATLTHIAGATHA